MGFEALLWGKPVRCFGMPFYAGWGLTRDELPAPARARPARSRSSDWCTRRWSTTRATSTPRPAQRCEAERAGRLDGAAAAPARALRAAGAGGRLLALEEADRARLLRRQRRCASCDARAAAARRAQRSRVWGRARAGRPRRAERAAARRGRLPALGRPGRRPGAPAVVGDRPPRHVLRRHARRPTSKRCCAGGASTAALLARARALREAHRRARASPSTTSAPARWQRPRRRRGAVVLVPGQVETDASIALGAPGVRTQPRPAAGGARGAARTPTSSTSRTRTCWPACAARRGRRRTRRTRWCDEIVTDVPIHRLLDAVDEVHVLTSLAGFEALLRGKPVRLPRPALLRRLGPDRRTARAAARAARAA